MGCSPEPRYPCTGPAGGPSLRPFAPTRCHPLQSPLYRPLLEHQQADLLRTVQMQPDVALLIVGVRSNIPTSEPGVTQKIVYTWTLRLQGEGAGHEHNCWLSESVQPISQHLFGGPA